MAWYEIWKEKPTITEQLNKHLEPFTFDEKVKELKSIVKKVLPGVHVGKNPPRGVARKPKAPDAG